VPEGAIAAVALVGGDPAIGQEGGEGLAVLIRDLWVRRQLIAAAETAIAEANLASDAAEAAHIETLRKASDMTRSRFDGGRVVTMKQVGYVEVLDKMKLDPVALWPFIKEEYALQALKAWAKTNSFRRPMDGAIVEMRDDTVIR
jgi:hypothetical protein